MSCKKVQNGAVFKNSQSRDMIREFFDLFDLMSAQGSLTFEVDLTAAYVRNAWQLRLYDIAGNPVDIQFTFDREIAQRMGANAVLVDAYDPSHVVTEVKIPVDYAGLTGRDIENVLGLFAVVNVLSELQKYHIESRYSADHGKRSHAFRIFRSGQIQLINFDPAFDLP